MHQLFNSINVKADYENVLNKEAIIYPSNIMNYGLSYEIPETYKQNAYDINPYDYTKAQKLSFPDYPKKLIPANEEFDNITNRLVKTLNEREIDVSGTMYSIKDIKTKIYPSVRQY